MMIKRNVTTMRRARGSLSAGAVLVGAALMLSLPAGPALAAPVSVQDTTETVIGHAPTATPTLSSTSPVAGDTLTVASGFIDADGDEESGTTYQWQIEKTVAQDDWQDMPVTVTTYKVQPEDSGKKIRVGVIPATDPAITDPSVGGWVDVLAKRDSEGAADAGRHFGGRLHVHPGQGLPDDRV